METLFVCVVLLIVMFAVRAIKPLNEWRQKTKYFSIVFMIGLVVLAFVSGTLGFQDAAYEDLTWRDKNFNILIMFFMNYSDAVGENNWLDISRFSAALFCVSAVFLVLEGVIDRAFMRLMGFSKKSILIFGETEAAARLQEAVWPYGISTTEKYIPVRGRVILMGSDDENLKFYSENEARLKGKSTYFKTENFPGLSIGSRESIRFFSFEEIAANSYWLKFPLVPECTTMDEMKKVLDTKRDFKVAIVGNNTLMEELLLYGTQLNIYNENSTVEYHIFGENTEFKALHRYLDKLHIIVHENPWYLDDEGNTRENLSEFDRVIVVQQENQAKLLHQLRLVDADVITHVFVPFENQDVNRMKEIFEQDRGGMILRPGAVVLYPWLQDACTVENIFSVERFAAAMDLNYYYDIKGDWGSLPKTYNDKWIANYPKLSKSEKKKQRAAYEKLVYSAWCELSSYHKYSNLFSATYAWKYHLVAKDLAKSPEYLWKVKRLEHIRWNHYNYFFNWRKDLPKELAASVRRDISYVESNDALSAKQKEAAVQKLQKQLDKKTSGRTKDWNWRIHQDLVPFEKLSCVEQEKDDFIASLLRYCRLKEAFGGK